MSIYNTRTERTRATSIIVISYNNNSDNQGAIFPLTTQKLYIDSLSYFYLSILFL